MSNIRKIKKIMASRPTMEGAGVRLKRAFGEVHPDLDPFLLLDDFHSSNPADYLRGFPWHPHRGIETITYMHAGTVAHEDSLGNAGVIGPGDVQWMTAGSGIIHSEMPQRTDGELRGFQLWANLPAAKKMIPPRYQGITAAEIVETNPAPGVTVKVVCGSFGGTAGPVNGVAADPEYFDITLKDGAAIEHPAPPKRNIFAYVIGGSIVLSPESDPTPTDHLAIYDRGDSVKISAGPGGGRFLLVSGVPLREPVAWGGPIVMNTEQELQQAFAEYQAGTFIK